MADVKDPLIDAAPGLDGPPEQAVVTVAPALWTRHGSPPQMPRPHRHDDIELNLVHSGRLEYLFGGSHIRVEAGQVALFWGATPHQLIWPGTSAGEVSWVHIPLATALSWSLAADDVAMLLQPEPIIVPASSTTRDVAALFESWQAELLAEDASIALLEAQAFVRRVLRDHHHRVATAPLPEDAGASGPGGPQQVRAGVVMARYIAVNFREQVCAADVAATVHLNPTYAMTVFRQAVGTTIGTYLTRCRVAESQRLLISTSMTTAEVAHASGFGSQSTFYDHFTRTCGQAPGAYRASLRRTA